MTLYDELYQLHSKLSAERLKILKAQARISELEKQIAKLKGEPPKEGWDVT